MSQSRYSPYARKQVSKLPTIPKVDVSPTVIPDSDDNYSKSRKGSEIDTKEGIEETSYDPILRPSSGSSSDRYLHTSRPQFMPDNDNDISNSEFSASYDSESNNDSDTSIIDKGVMGSMQHIRDRLIYLERRDKSSEERSAAHRDRARNLESRFNKARHVSKAYSERYQEMVAERAKFQAEIEEVRRKVQTHKNRREDAEHNVGKISARLNNSEIGKEAAERGLAKMTASFKAAQEVIDQFEPLRLELEELRKGKVGVEGIVADKEMMIVVLELQLEAAKVEAEESRIKGLRKAEDMREVAEQAKSQVEEQRWEWSDSLADVLRRIQPANPR